MKFILQSVFRGLAILLPVIITIELLRWLFMKMETWLAPLLTYVLPGEWYLPGLGILSFLALSFFIGFSARYKGIAWLWQLPGKVLLRIPGAKQIYGMLHDIVDVMSGKNFADESVVLVKLPQSDVELISIVTKKGGITGDSMSELLEEEQLAVFLPMAYNVGGYTIIVPQSCTRSIDMKPAEALQLVISGGLGNKS